jgi:outer membrane protein assembly factor BamB
MPRHAQNTLYVGIKNYCVALHHKDGTEFWRTKLSRSDFTIVLWDGEELFAANSGEIYRLDPEDGSVIWHNKMKGMGIGVVSLARTGATAGPSFENLAMQKKREAAAAAG